MPGPGSDAGLSQHLAWLHQPPSLASDLVSGVTILASIPHINLKPRPLLSHWSAPAAVTQIKGGEKITRRLRVNTVNQVINSNKSTKSTKLTKSQSIQNVYQVIQSTKSESICQPSKPCQPSEASLRPRTFMSSSCHSMLCYVV